VIKNFIFSAFRIYRSALHFGGRWGGRRFTLGSSGSGTWALWLGFSGQDFPTWGWLSSAIWVFCIEKVKEINIPRFY